MKKLFLIFIILLFTNSCKNEDSTFTNLENLSFENFSPENFYKIHNILNSQKVNVDSLKAYDKETSIGSYELKPFDIAPKENNSYKNYSYYSQIQDSNDHITEKEINERNIIGVIPVHEIAFFKEIKFNYANFIVDKRNNKTVGSIFTTSNHSETDYYKKNIELISKNLGKPKYTYRGFTDDNGGPVHYPLLYDIWILNRKIYQFQMNLSELGADKYESITLLILNENLVDTFDSSFNNNFTIFKDYFEQERANRFNIENLLFERIEKKNLDEANKRARKVLDSIKANYKN